MPTTATAAQRASSRNNALQSTGPRSPEGKARSSMNALKTGIHAESAVVLGESPELFAALTAEYFDHHRPNTPQQRALVDTLVTCEWQRRRMVRIEPEVWLEQACMEQAAQNGTVIVAAAGRAWLAGSQQLTRLQRRLDALHRTFVSALASLQSLQATEGIAEIAAPAPLPLTAQIFTAQATEEQPLESSSASFRSFTQPASDLTQVPDPALAKAA